MPDQPDISAVIPAFNEERRLPAALGTLSSYLETLGRSWEIIPAIEKCSDRTLPLALEAAAREPRIRVLGNPDQRGKGHAVRTGMLAARGRLRFFMDADLSVPVEEIGTFLEHFDRRPEIDILIGNRQHALSQIVVAQSPLRQSMGRTFNRLLRALLPVAILDTQCGFKAFRAPAAIDLFSRQTVDGFAFDVEILLLAERLGYRTADLPVRWINSTDSKVHLAAASIQMLRDTLRIRARLARARKP